MLYKKYIKAVAAELINLMISPGYKLKVTHFTKY